MKISAYRQTNVVDAAGDEGGMHKLAAAVAAASAPQRGAGLWRPLSWSDDSGWHAGPDGFGLIAWCEAAQRVWIDGNPFKGAGVGSK